MEKSTALCYTGDGVNYGRYVKMPYFQRTDSDEYTRSFDPRDAREEEEDYSEDDSYDDGFDELTDEEDPVPKEDPLSEEERRLEKRRRFRIAAGIGDLSAVLFGTALILALVALLINMIQFVASDFSQNFSLFQTRF